MQVLLQSKVSKYNVVLQSMRFIRFTVLGESVPNRGPSHLAVFVHVAVGRRIYDH